jgi:DNA polymerase-3 subunit epsilon
VGVVIVRDGEIVDTFYSLIQPEPNYYNYWCSQVHGLTREDTEEAPVFPERFYNYQLIHIISLSLRKSKK